MAREKKSKKMMPQIFIFVEGETEEIYFDRIKQLLRLPFKVRVIQATGNGNWIEKAMNTMRSPEFKDKEAKKVYVIFDKDNKSTEDLEKMSVQANKNKIKIGFSNTSFEVWILSHFERLNENLITQSELEKRISKHIGHKYSKTEKNTLNSIADSYQTAMKNSQDIANTDFGKQCTTIGHILCNLEQLKPKR